jgi:dTMP kinase
MSAGASATARGFFVTFEGIEGSGKSTQIRDLAQRLQSLGHEAVTTREPGGTALGLGLRSLLLASRGPAVGALAELLLYTADRAQHWEEVIEPALAAGRSVLCDRHLDATLAYQGHARGLGFDTVLAFHRLPPLDRRPDRTVLLEIPVEVGLARARRRNSSTARAAKEARYENESMAFHRRVQEGYRLLARQHARRYRVVDADAAPDEVARRVAAALADLWPELGDGR